MKLYMVHIWFIYAQFIEFIYSLTYMDHICLFFHGERKITGDNILKNANVVPCCRPRLLLEHVKSINRLNILSKADV